MEGYTVGLGLLHPRTCASAGLMRCYKVKQRHKQLIVFLDLFSMSFSCQPGWQLRHAGIERTLWYSVSPLNTRLNPKVITLFLYHTHYIYHGHGVYVPLRDIQLNPAWSFKSLLIATSPPKRFKRG